jgi:ABC-type sugar transport system ATPase subunit
MEVLQAQNITKRYGEAHALKSASFGLGAAEIHALMGENGAGKSTMSKIIGGAVRPDAGEIFIDGKPVAIHSPRDAQSFGISSIYQELDLFPHCTVGENIVIGNLHYPEGSITDVHKIEAFCKPFVEQVGLKCSLRELVAHLSIGQRQMIAIARALSMQAHIILMDEPTSSLAEDAVEQFFQLMIKLRANGTSIVYVSHKMDEIFRLCDRITILRDGETIGTRDIVSTSRDELIQMIVGRDIGAAKRLVVRSSRQVILSVAGLTTRKIKNISFNLHKGEVLGIAGLVGAGRSELGAALAGLDRIESGTVTLAGQPYAPRSVADALQRGFALLPEDRKVDGLMMRMSVLENGSLAALSQIQRGGFISREKEKSAVMPTLGRLRMKCASVFHPVSSLSGGNQQKALLARLLVLNPEVLFLDDPARGIDIGAKQDIYHIVEELAASGKSILFVSSELPELLRCCDRIVVLREGRLTGTLSAEEATQERIMALATANI